MPEDIETLLRDAGRGPTRHLDADQVHAAGRRRARGRTVAAGAGALALLAVAVIGVNALVPTTPDAPFVEQTPSEPEPAPDDEAPQDDGAGDLDTATRSTIARVTQDLDGGVEVTLTATDGTTTSFASDAQAGDLAGSVIVDGDGRAVVATAAGDLVRSGPDGTTVLAEGDADAGTPWSVHGTTDAGEVLVSRIDVAGSDELLVVRGDDLVAWRSPSITASMPEERFGTATAVGDRLLVTLGVGDSVRWLLYAGDAAPVEVLTASTMPFDTVPDTPVLVGDEVWHLETRATDEPDGAAPQDLVLRRGEELVRVPTPYGREVDAFVGAASVGQLADGSPALVLSSIARDRSGPGIALLVDLDAARAVATAAGDGEVPDGVFVELGDPAHVRFVP
jgi:hypothetical protein